MTNLLLYTHPDSTWLIALQWGVGILFLIFLFVSLFVQRRVGKRLKAELEELDKIRKGNVEYDFILKAMKIAGADADKRDSLSGYRIKKRIYRSVHKIPLI